jgi:hypothetical protein
MREVGREPKADGQEKLSRGRSSMTSGGFCFTLSNFTSVMFYLSISKVKLNTGANTGTIGTGAFGNDSGNVVSGFPFSPPPGTAAVVPSDSPVMATPAS